VALTANRRGGERVAVRGRRVRRENEKNTVARRPLDSASGNGPVWHIF
jgi:hypothetical protein